MIQVLNVSPGVEGYTSLISGYAARGDVRNAFRIYDKMLASKLRPSSFTLSALMSSCLQSNQMHLARQLIESSLATCTGGQANEKEGLESLYGTYIINLAMRAKTSADLETVSGAYEAMMEKGLKPDVATTNAYLQCICDVTGDLDLAVKVFRTLESPDDFTHSILFTALGKQGQLQLAMQLYEERKRPLDTPAINSLLRGFVSSDAPLRTIQLFNYLLEGKEKGMKRNFTSPSVEAFVPNKITFTTLYAALLRSTRPASPDSAAKPSEGNPQLTYDASSNRFYEVADRTLEASQSKSQDNFVFSALPPLKYEILKSLFSSMRFRYNIEPDDVMVSTLNALFLAITKPVSGSGVNFRGTISTY